MKDTISFGWLPEDCSLAASEYVVKPSDGYADAVNYVKDSGQIDSDGWYHPPVDTGPPQRAASVFRLPSTHVLSLDDESEGQHKLSSFLIMVLGLLKGLRLVPADWAHFYRVPTRPHQLTDFYVTEAAVPRVLTLALDSWHSSTAEIRRLMFGAFHWHSFGRTYRQPFEIFNAQYTVLDTAWRIYQLRSSPGATTHAKRVEVLASAYGIPLPDWAVVKKKASFLSALRNELLHEGMWGGEPTGFGHPQEHRNIYRELHALNSRILLATISDRSRYVTSKVDRNMRLLR